MRRSVGDLVRLGTPCSFNHAKTGRNCWLEVGTLVIIESINSWSSADGCYYLRTTDGLYVGSLFAHEVLDVEDAPLRLLAEQGE
jgi:hypothetical protein